MISCTFQRTTVAIHGQFSIEVAVPESAAEQTTLNSLSNFKAVISASV